jgi:hypothetical protein
VVRSTVSVFLILAACAAPVARANTAEQASSDTQVASTDIVPAVYQRVSTQATIMRANWARHGGPWGGGGWGWGYPGFYNPWVAPQVYGGTWYQRPYPDHLIYNNVRSGMPIAPAACGLADEAVSVEVAPER